MPTIKSERVAENDIIMLALNDKKKSNFKSVHTTTDHNKISYSMLLRRWKDGKTITESREDQRNLPIPEEKAFERSLFLCLLSASSMKRVSMIASGTDFVDFERKRCLIELKSRFVLPGETCFRIFGFLAIYPRFSFFSIIGRNSLSFDSAFPPASDDSRDFVHCLADALSIVDQASSFLSSCTECIARETGLDCLILLQ